MRFLSLFLPAAVIAGMLACASAATPEPAQVVLAGHHFTVEIAKTEASREQGLMYRTHLAADHGMLFVYPDAQVRRFWMKHTLIPLDILFFDADRRLINVSADTPPCKTANCPTYASATPAMYVLELAAGSAARLRITTGDSFTLEP
ncbi:MAG TPA: DUF192 domain-containing protein [Gammaproteobacteria bacterium]|nr:DUF192 domain-containing protein [Gammaproteobacteria bacterium]